MLPSVLYLSGTLIFSSFFHFSPIYCFSLQVVPIEELRRDATKISVSAECQDHHFVDLYLLKEMFDKSSTLVF